MQKIKRFKCEKCNKIIDIPIKTLEMDEQIKRGMGIGFSLSGICMHCHISSGEKKGRIADLEKFATMKPLPGILVKDKDGNIIKEIDDD